MHDVRVWPTLSTCMNRKLLLFGALGLISACAHRRPILPGMSPDRWFAANDTLFQKSVESRSHQESLLQSGTPVFVHGSFDWTAFVWKDGRPLIEGWENADKGAWWNDLLRIETSALLLAESQSLRTYREGACWNSYKQGLAAITEGTRAPLPTPVTPLPALPSQEKTSASYAESPEWKNSLPEVDDSWRKAFERGLPTGISLQEVRRVSVPTASLAHYVGHLADGKWVEFEELAENEKFKSGCDRYIQISRAIGIEARCLAIGGRSFAVKFSPEKWSRPEARDFNAENLAGQLAWMCRNMATLHSKQMSLPQARALYLTLEYNPVFVERLKSFSRDEANRTLVEYRSSITSSP